VKPLDYLKAAGLALLVLAIDVLIAFGVVYAWGSFLEPGHTQAFYETAGVPMARWSTRIAGTALMAGAAWLFARRSPQRNAYAFATVVVFFYAFFDGASVLFAGFFTWSMALTMLLKLIAGLAGAYVARGR
jgi:hypothetical protein